MHNDLSLNNTLIRFEHVHKVFEPQHEVALRDVNFSIAKGEFVTFVGPSGEGKSTVLKLIAGLEPETDGVIIKPPTVGMVFQTVALFPWLTVFENVAIGLRAQEKSDRVATKTAESFIHLMKLDEFANKYPADLSGGQRQRVGIARALAVDPDVLLLDEPFSALDARTTAELHDDIISIWHATQKTILLVSHSIEEAVSLSQRVVLIKNNTVAGTFPIFLSYPRREQTTEFGKTVNEIRKQFFK